MSCSEYRTFLSYDFSPNGAEAGAYAVDGHPGWTTADGEATKPARYGPSSCHPDVVITGMGDGSVHVLSKHIDAGDFYFLVTKNNHDSFFRDGESK